MQNTGHGTANITRFESNITAQPAADDGAIQLDCLFFHRLAFAGGCRLEGRPPDFTVQTVTRVFRPVLSAIEDAARRIIVGSLDPEAYAFYARLMAEGCAPNSLIVALPSHRIIYVCVPKCASSQIRQTLSRLIGYSPASSWEANNRRYSGLKGPKHVGLSTFHRLAIDPMTLRFAFVRNPYARLVSCWTDKFRGKPLVAGDSWVDKYLAWHAQASPSHPIGPDCTLQFADFVNFATATAQTSVDYHWHLQVDMLDMPGIKLDLIGRVETFARDFARVLDHVQASEAIRQSALAQLNESSHGPWSTYYTPELADRVYRTYERDFDELQYPRRLLPAARARDLESGRACLPANTRPHGRVATAPFFRHHQR